MSAFWLGWVAEARRISKVASSIVRESECCRRGIPMGSPGSPGEGLERVSKECRGWDKLPPNFSHQKPALVERANVAGA